MSVPDHSMPGMVTDVDEVARFAAERRDDADAERWLALGQALMLLLVVLVVALLVALGQV